MPETTEADIQKTLELARKLTVVQSTGRNPMPNKLPKLKLEITANVNPDFSLGGIQVSLSCGRRSGYCLKNPFESLALQESERILLENFKRVAPRKKKTDA